MGSSQSSQAPTIPPPATIPPPPTIPQPTTTPANYADATLANTIITKQESLIKNLQDAINQYKNILSIDASQISGITTTIPATTMPATPSTTASVERFANVSSNTQDYDVPPFYLANNNSPEVKDYIEVYNKSIALLDDPNKLNQAQFDTYIHLQNKKINELQNAINTFPTNRNTMDQPIKAIKNIKTSTALNVEEYPNPQNNRTQPTTYRGNGAPTYPNYLIYGNNGCLQYTKETTNPNAPASWAFQSCNANDSKQRFNMSKINTLADYNGKITDPNHQNRQILDTNSVIMGFYVVNPETAADQCLMLNEEGLSVMPCNMDASQRFKQLYHSVNP